MAAHELWQSWLATTEYELGIDAKEDDGEKGGGENEGEGAGAAARRRMPCGISGSLFR